MEAVSEDPGVKVGESGKGTFKKGADTRRAGGRPRKEYVAPVEDGAPLVLQDMRHVYLNPGKFDKTQGHKTARSLMNKDPKGFMSQLAALERDHRGALREEEAREVARGEARAAKGEDVGTDACLALCEEAIRKYGER